MQAQVDKKVITKEVITKVEEEVTTVTLTLSLEEASLLRTAAYAVASYGSTRGSAVARLMNTLHAELARRGVPAPRDMPEILNQVRHKRGF